MDAGLVAAFIQGTNREGLAVHGDIEQRVPVDFQSVKQRAIDDYA
jgi:hypothetical protein